MVSAMAANLVTMAMCVLAGFAALPRAAEAGNPGLIRIPVGLILSPQSEHMNLSFRYALKLANVKEGRLMFDPVDEFTDIDNSFDLERAICSELSKGIFVLIGDTTTASLPTAQAFTDIFHMPMLTPSFPMPHNVASETNHYQVYMHPGHMKAVYDIIKYYKWDTVYYLIVSDEGLPNLERLFILLGPQSAKSTFNIIPRFISHDNSTAKKQLESVDGEEDKITPRRLIVDCQTLEATQRIMDLLAEIKMTTKYYHYVIASFASEQLNMSTFGHDGANVTGLRILERSGRALRDFYNGGDWGGMVSRTLGIPAAKQRTLMYDAALIYDSVRVINKAFTRMLTEYPNALKSNFRRGEVYNNGSRGIGDCDMNEVVPWERGEVILDYIKQVVIHDGLTGTIAFDERGRRINYTIHVWEFTLNREKAWIGEWTSRMGFRNLRPNIYRDKDNYVFENKTKYITSILEDPYLMLKKDDNGNAIEGLEGNERYQGYCADLAEMIANKVQFKYEIRLVADNQYGTEMENGEWNAWSRELRNGEVDMAIAGMTITAARESVVDFSKPFMSLGISIMIMEPEKPKPGVFSFMNPLSYEIWMCIIFAMIGVSVVLFLVSRFSPYEWRVEYTGNGPEIVNDFNIFNSLWFSLGAFMQQGCDISPRSISGRIVGSVWWFFTLIMISSYTANLAAFLTVERMTAPIESADDLAKQMEIQYGTYQGGSTFRFFKKSTLPTYKRMWSFMSTQKPSVFTESTKAGIERVRKSKGTYAFLLESTTNEYENNRKPCTTIKVGSDLDSKGYGVATPLGSDLREKITFAVLKLREDGDLQKLRTRWWYDNTECFDRETAKDSAQSNELTLNNFAGIFYILIGGLVFSIITAVIEFIYRSVSKHRSINALFFQDTVQSNELNMMNVAGIFYILIGGLVLSMLAAVAEFVYRSRDEANESKQSLMATMKQKMQMSLRGNMDVSEAEETTEQDTRGAASSSVSSF
ncbi:PREDICTED: LOW QUALITY PROTEIN: glutamate receptor 3-like [Priapulus caudatus]|uniref:LOW QUALITY PROTEIN: glutamate receptor 3-like n=1 Tax=Priapulus caudatus TaxID=37621 RepID=A0ABM1EES8_PRICU|nr:PREDICTED: LOW QUALITY PROTEIN: glutamate receptor 3-like [Priapulus caudatus]